jgi:hypothetical protein
MIVGVYARGDFMVHLAGLNDKSKWMRNVLHETDSWSEEIDEIVNTPTDILKSRKELLAPSQ